MKQIICSGIKGFRRGCNRGSKMSDTKNIDWLTEDKCNFEGDDSALEKQVSGSHYKNYDVQPVEFCQKNKLNYCESAVIKYVCRHKDKNGKEDILKAIHYLELLLEIEYADKDQRQY